MKTAEEKIYKETDRRVTLASNTILFLATVIAGINNGKREDLVELDMRNAHDNFQKLQKHFTITRKP